MSDVPPVQGPSASPQKPEESAKPHSDFQEVYKKKVEAIDPDEAKKRKQKHEAEEEASAEQTTKTDKGQELKERKPTISFREATSHATKHSSQETHLPPSPVEQDLTDQQSLPPSLPSPAQVPFPSVSETHAADDIVFPAQQADITIPSSIPLDSPRSPQTLAPSFSHEESLEDKESSSSVTPVEKKEKEGGESSLAIPLTTSRFLPLFPFFFSPYSLFPNTVRTLFDYMAGVVGSISHLVTKGDAETVVELNAPEFKDSIFYQCKIIVKQYESAPKEYAVELIGNPEAVKLLNKYKPQILGVFEKGNYAFKVRNIEGNLE